jgi:hypothetical protein
VVVSDACASYFPEFHRVAVAMIAAQGGIRLGRHYRTPRQRHSPGTPRGITIIAGAFYRNIN